MHDRPLLPLMGAFLLAALAACGSAGGGGGDPNPIQDTSSGIEALPALAADGKGVIWLATVDRSGERPCVRLYRSSGDASEPVAELRVPGLTGVGAPSLAGLPGGGCAVAFPAEVDDLWHLAWAFADDPAASPQVRLTAVEGNCTGVSLAATGARVCAAWEVNGTESRRVYAAWLEPDGPLASEALSPAGFNSYNPRIVGLGEGNAFAVWDSLRGESWDIYGARLRGSSWEPEARLTSDPRLESHASPAARAGEVWLAWQAQSFPGQQIHFVGEQRVCVARINDTDGSLEAPVASFEAVSPGAERLARPEIAFDPVGRLWLSARRSLGLHAGWRAIASVYSGDTWSDPFELSDANQGRYQSVPLVYADANVFGAVQRDNVPSSWNHRGLLPGWRSDVQLREASPLSLPPAEALRTERLEMPPTSFRLGNRMAQASALLSRQSIERPAGGTLRLYWGDLHEHTDISVCTRGLNPPLGDFLARQQDIERLDFTAVTDHGYDFDRPIWASAAEGVRAAHVPGRFVTFLGQEWTSDSVPPLEGGRYPRYGHRTLIHIDPYFPEFFDAYDGPNPPGALWYRVAPGQVIGIPHQLADTGNAPVDWTHVDTRYEPVAEIYQHRGSYEAADAPLIAKDAMASPGYYLQDAWARGTVIGVVASPDHGGGRGKAGVWARELSRAALFEAILARHTFGTTGAKIALWLGCGEAMMGDVVPYAPAGEPLRFEVRVTTTRPVTEILLLRNNRVVASWQPGTVQADLSWVDEEPLQTRSWYYARVTRADGEMAWSSPIWFQRLSG